MNHTAQPLCPCPVHPAGEGGAVLRQRLPCRGGEVLLTRYLLFPGMALTYRDVHAAAWEAAGEAGCLTTVSYTHLWRGPQWAA